MTFPLGQLNLINGVNTSFTTPFTGLKGLIIGNESGLDCDIDMGGSGVRKKLYPGTLDYFEVRTGYNGVVIVKPTLGLQVGILYPSSYLTFDMVGATENINVSVYPLALGRQMQAGLPSPQVGFGAFVVFTTGVTSTLRFMLNIFNTAAKNSGIIARIYAIQVKQTGAGIVTSNLSIRTDGTDNNLGGGTAQIFTHNIGGVGSKMHVTFANNTAIPAQNTFVGTTELDNDLYDYAGSRGAYYLNPLQNLTMDVQASVSGSFIAMSYDWTE